MRGANPCAGRRGSAGPTQSRREWVAFGDGSIVPTAGGDILSPIGRSGYWQWSPTDDVLAGVTPAGGVVVGGPEDPRRMVLDDGSGAEQVAFSSDGGSLEVVTGANRVAVVDVVDGITTTVYRVSPGRRPRRSSQGGPGRPLGVVLLEAPGACRGAASTPPRRKAATG